ncbi:hypothetical protein ES703_120636 [subsurface metagenome]
MTDPERFCAGILFGMAICLAVRTVIDAIINQWRKDHKDKNKPRP